MKILIILPAIGLSYGGPSKSIIELAKATGRQGIYIDIITTNADTSVSLNVPLNQWIAYPQYRIQYFPYLPFSDYKVSPSLLTWLWNHIKDYDLVHTNAIFSLNITLSHWFCRWQNIPYIITPRGMLEPWALSYKAWKKQIYYRVFEQPTLQTASTIQVLATKEAEGIQPLNLKTSLTQIPNGIHVKDFQTLPSPDLFFQKFPTTLGKHLILFLGRIDPKKGLDLLAQAFGIVHHKFPNTHLIVAGQDNIGFLSTAKEFFSRANCLDAVTFTGMLTGALKYSALAAANIYVAPSYSEGFSMSVLEGMASGLPCVITTGCNFAEAKVAKAAYVVDIDAGAITKALIDCLSNPEEAKAMGDRARQFILENYTWDKIAIRLIDVYASILGARSDPKLNPVQ